MNSIWRTAIATAVLFCIGMDGGTGRADSLAVSAPRLEPAQDGGQVIRVDVQWENSWRNDGAGAGHAAPGNHDAAWLFVKYRADSGPWEHAHLSPDAAAHAVPAGAALAVGQTRGKGVGVFLCRATNGTGPFAAANVGLRWLRAADHVAAGAKVTVNVLALEMVHVPPGAFLAGDGLTDGAQFYAGGGGNRPFRIESESAIPIGPAAGQLFYDRAGDWCGDQAGMLPKAFPKGYAAFYGMKYELTQAQYADFLSTLTPKQADIRWDTWWKSFCDGPWAPDAAKCGITKHADGAYRSSMPDKACGFLRWADMAAYLDWAGLRPMTELEFEKACRGPLAPVPGEFAWGDTKYVPAKGLVNEGEADEQPANPDTANIALHECVMMRVGCLGAGTGSRHLTGAGYYGMTELSGNQMEPAVSAGSAIGRCFTGQHGDGLLTEDGFADVPDWPKRDAKGSGWRGGGGGWAANIEAARVSDRKAAALGGKGDTDGHYLYGVRGVRTAPAAALP